MENYSKQRTEIIEIIEELYNHPTAEEIYFLIKQKDPSVSRSTVYRNLKRFVNAGKVIQIPVSNGPDRYDYNIGREKHGHVVCQKCGKIYDFFYDFDINNIKSSIIKQTEVEIADEEMLFKGICKECREAQY